MAYNALSVYTLCTCMQIKLYYISNFIYRTVPYIFYILQQYKHSQSLALLYIALLECTYAGKVGSLSITNNV